MYGKRLARACMTVMLLGLGTQANALFHLWQISEIYSNADGTVQFIELSTTFGSQQFVGGHVIAVTQGATTHSFTLPSDLPSDSTNKTFLIGTQGFASLNLVTPDYVVADNFLFLGSGTIDWAGADVVSYASLPADGSLSIDRSGVTHTNSPRNFAGATGTIVPPPPPTVPGAPAIGSAVAGSAQAIISFTPPASNGGSPITSYTATCNPGAVSATGAASPITVGGLTDGVLYSCFVVATNAVGTGPASSTVTVTPTAVASASGPSATGTGTIVASFTGGGASCGFTSAQFIALQGSPASPPAASAPAGIVFPHGLFAFTTAGCTAASTLTLVVAYPAPLPAATQYWKYGPTATQPAPHWYTLPATILGNTVTFTITDGGLGDDDLAANGTIVDQGGPGSPGTASAIPTLDEWSLIGLAMLLAASGFVAVKRRRYAPIKRR